MEYLLDHVLDDVMKEVEMNALRPKKKCKMLPVKPFQGFVKTPQQIENEAKMNSKIDQMIDVLNRRLITKPNNERLEIFQNLQKLDIIAEFYQVSEGGVSKSTSGFKTELQERPDDDKEDSKADPEVENDQKESEPGDDESKEPATHILDVFKCNKCNHAFEKINLFVKHFLKVHKDVIDANKNSSSFSFSNFWTKMKVKAAVKKKQEEKQEETKKTDVKTNITKPKMTLMEELSSLKLFEFRKPLSKAVEVIDRLDLSLTCETERFVFSNKVSGGQETIVPTSQQELPSTTMLFNQFCYQDLESEHFASEVFVDDEVVAVEVEDDPELTNHYQTVPMTEIKTENPFEELPFTWKIDDFVPEVVVSHLDHEPLIPDDLVLGQVEDAEDVCASVVFNLLDHVDSIISLNNKDDEVEEVHTEDVHHENKRDVSHQVYIKDFAWIPLEDQFSDCADHEKDDIAQLFIIKKMRTEEKMSAVKTLLLNTDNDIEIIKSYVERIVGCKYLPALADHQETRLAKSKYIKFDHNYLPSIKSKNNSSRQPSSNVVEALKRMKSKVEIVPVSGTDLFRKPSFVGVKPPPRRVNNNLKIYLNQNTMMEKKPRIPVKTGVGRNKIQIFPAGREKDAPVEYLDMYLDKLYPKKPEFKFVDETQDDQSHEESLDQSFEAGQTTLEEVVDAPSEKENTHMETDDQEEAHELSSSDPETASVTINVVKRKRDDEIEAEQDHHSTIDNSPKRMRPDDHDSASNNDENDLDQLNSIEEAWRSIDEFLGDNTLASTETNSTVVNTAPGPPLPSSCSSAPPEQSVPPSGPSSQLSPGSADANYQSQLEKHLDSLREPPPPALDVAPPPVQTADSYNIIKQEPVEFTPSSSQQVLYNIKTEDNLATFIGNIKQEKDGYGFEVSTMMMKTERVKLEPVDHSGVVDDDDIEVLSIDQDVSDTIDMVTSIVRCGECFRSFSTKQELSDHSLTHILDSSSSDDDYDDVLSEQTIKKISSSSFPKIVLTKVSLDNHQYIFGDIQDKKEEIVPTKKDEEKKKVEKLTVLQALDSLFQPSKRSNDQKSKSPSVKKTVKSKEKSLTSKSPAAKSGKSMSLTCQVCSKVNCVNMESMRKHLTFHPHTQCQGKVNICCICDEKFDTRDSSFTSHVDDHMSEMRRSQDHQCLGCGSVFQTSDTLMKHVETVHQIQKIFPCSLCSETFLRKKKLLLHQDTLHSNSTN